MINGKVINGPWCLKMAFGLIVLSFLLSFSYRFGGLRRLPSSGFMNMYMYKLAIVFFILLSLSGPAMHWQC